MGQVALNIPQVGALNSTEDPKVAGNFNVLQTLVNGNIDLTNLSAGAIAALQASTAPLSSHTFNVGPGSRTNTAYGAMSDAADQISGLVLPANGVIAVWYQALWQESVAGAARAAIFIGANQLKVQSGAGVTMGPNTQAAATNSGTANENQPLITLPVGLASTGPSGASGAFAADVTTGQAMGVAIWGSTGAPQVPNIAMELAGTVENFQNSSGTLASWAGGPCVIDNLPAGTYTVGVQFKSSSGTVTRSSARLRAQVIPF